MNLSNKQRENVAKVFFDLSKYIFTILVLSQFLAPDKFQIGIFIGGSFGFVLFLCLGIIADKGKE